MKPLEDMVKEQEHPILVDADTKTKGTMLYYQLLKQMDCLVNGTDENG